MSRLARAFPVRAVKRYLDCQGPNWATLIAWNGLFAMLPMILVVATILGAVLHSQGIASGVEQQVVRAFPNHGDQQTITKALAAFKDKSGILGLIAFGGLLWSGSGLFGAIEQGLSTLYGSKTRDFVRQKLMAFLMMLLFTLLAIPLVLSGSLLPALRSLSVVPSVLTSGPAALLIQVGLGVLDAALLFFAIYFVVPNRRQRVRHVLPGAFTAGVLLEALTLLFPLYFKLAGGFATYGATFALFFLLMTYAFFLGQITMLGGAVNAELEASRAPAGRLTPPPGAAAPVAANVVGRLNGLARRPRSGTGERVTVQKR